MIISNSGAWENNSLEGHAFDNLLCENIIKFCKKNKIKNAYDFGCGHGKYTLELNKNEIKCSGYDGNPYTKNIANEFCDVLDLTTDFNLDKKDLVISLEVGEHIPEKYENHLIERLKKHSKKYIILSWAVEGQGGDGHVNCKNNNYIKSKFEDDFINLIDDENIFRENCELPWFKNTIMIFKRK